MYAAYKSGVEAFRSMRESQGLSLEKVEDVKAEMEELLEESEDVAAVLSKGKR